MLYQHKNLAWATVSTGYDADDLSIDLTAGHGARFPQPGAGFYLVWWNYTDYTWPGDDPNVEIVLCTFRSTDNIGITRAQGGTSASTKNTASKTYRLMQVMIREEFDLKSDIGCAQVCSQGYFTP